MTGVGRSRLPCIVVTPEVGEQARSTRKWERFETKNRTRRSALYVRTPSFGSPNDGVRPDIVIARKILSGDSSAIRRDRPDSIRSPAR
jgi:hypothetical protein